MNLIANILKYSGNKIQINHLVEAMYFLVFIKRS